MANYYTYISFEFELPTAEAANEAVAFLAEIEEVINGDEDITARFPAFKDFEMGSGVRVEAEGRKVWVYDDCGCPELEFVATWLREVLKVHDPDGAVGFNFATDCDKHRLDAFMGGAVFVTSEAVTWTNTYDWLREQEAAHQARQQNGRAS
jgi:hypothetical protein